MNKIVAMWATAANRGLKEAQYNLAIMYRHGRGIPQSNAEAVRWYRCAASQVSFVSLFPSEIRRIERRRK